MSSILLKRAAAPLQLLVLAASCLATVAVWAQQKPVPGAAFSESHASENAPVNRPLASSVAFSQASFGSGRGTADWLMRLRQTTRIPAYAGTYVVWSASGTLASSRIWRANKGEMQIERVDALSGERRSTYRATDQHGSVVATFWFARRMLSIDHGDAPSGGGFPNLLEADQGVSPAAYYDAQQNGQERVAGLMADVVRLTPRDDLRYGYRVWSEQRTGLPIKLQTLDEHGRVLEQAAFSGLTFNAPISAAMLARQMRRTRGWGIERVVRAPTTAMAEGWRIGDPAGQPVPGFALQRCYRQPVLIHAAGVQTEDRLANRLAPGDDSMAEEQNKGNPLHWFQCMFSDGLAAVSVFIEPHDAVFRLGHHQDELDAALGSATHLLVRRVGDTGWVTVVGEVPPQTLKRFAAGVSRLP